ncbi:NOT5 [Candida oxycetoniae]|uniref:General negative regulator of transcription subunit n=1 Tax=Candida oxycetoniae TaxID=497107 RepID=A0AAI9WVZ1_9ASCO|nr:NOT5 [Candida oxycetoniae]KAI3402695.2 NOT5 [Candida oxycetoniae]
MSARKLQHEFDRLNKKISEGLTAFEEIKEKIQNCEVPSQRDKLENDLKKELKKLQRSRDQLKLWLADSNIKLDKSLLQENRTKIEQAMDDFKGLERHSKIKQFSNEGLELQKEMQKQSRFGDLVKLQEACEYISGVIQQLTNQNDELDRELEQLSQQSKKKNSHSAQNSIEDVKYKIDRNNNHIDRLEGVLDNLENDRLDPAKIDDVKDDLDFYVEMNQDDDYVEYDEFYDQLEVGDDDDEEVEVEGSLAQMAAESFEEEERKRLELQQLGNQQSEATRAAQTASSSSASVSASSSAHPHHPHNSNGKSIQTDAHGHVSAAASNANSTAATSVKKVNKQQNVVPAPPPTISGNTYSNAIKAAQAAQISNSSVAASTNASANASANANANVSITQNNAQQVNSSNSTPLVSNNVPLATALATTGPSTGSTIATTATTTPVRVAPPGLAHVSGTSMRSQSESPLAAQSKMSEGDHLRKKISNASQSSTITNNNVPYFGEAMNKLVSITNSRLNDPLPIQSISNLLESSLLNCPDSFDAEKPRQYTPRNVHPSLIDYPQEPMYELNSLHYMQKFDDDLLFFCFYYGEDEGMDNFAKWNAARELKKRGWDFNIELSQWFLKNDKVSNGTFKSRTSSSAILPSTSETFENCGPNSGSGSNFNSNSNSNSNSGGSHEETENGKAFSKYFDEKTWLTRNFYSRVV